MRTDSNERKTPVTAISRESRTGYVVMMCDPAPQTPAGYRKIWRKYHLATYGKALRLASQLEGRA